LELETARVLAHELAMQKEIQLDATLAPLLA